MSSAPVLRLVLSGAAVIEPEKYAVLGLPAGKGGRPRSSNDPDITTSLEKIFSRFSRFDRYTRWGCAAVRLALGEAGYNAGRRWRNPGFLLSGQYGSFITDLAYYATTGNGGQFASPQLFSYTLPNVVIGECSLPFGLTGPTYCLDGRGPRGGEALRQAVLHLESPSVEAMLVGWIEARPPEGPPGDEGAMVFFLTKERPKGEERLELETGAGGRLELPSGQSVRSLDDLLSLFSPEWIPHALGD